MPNSRGSCRSSISSFQMRNRMRRMLSSTAGAAGPRPAPARRAEYSDSAASCCQTTGSPTPLSTMPRSAIEEVARRHDVGDALQERRHARDRKDESRQHQRRQERREQRQLKRHLLGVGDARDQQAEPERADEKQRHVQQEQQPRSAHRQAEQHHRDEQDAERRDQRDDEVRNRLAEHERRRRRAAPSAPAPSCRAPSRARSTAPSRRRP